MFRRISPAFWGGLLLLFFVLPPKAPAASLKEKAAKIRAKAAQERSQLKQEISDAITVAKAEIGAYTKDMQVFFLEVREGIKFHLGRWREAFEELTQKAQEKVGDWTKRRVVVGLLRVRGNDMHTLALPEEGLWKKMKRLWNRDQPYLIVPIFLEWKKGEGGLEVLKRDRLEGILEGMDHTGTKEVPQFVGYWFAVGKNWTRPVFTEPSAEEASQLAPLFGDWKDPRGAQG